MDSLVSRCCAACLADPLMFAGLHSRPEGTAGQVGVSAAWHLSMEAANAVQLRVTFK
jgi:hypothetical protein